MRRLVLTVLFALCLTGSSWAASEAPSRAVQNLVQEAIAQHSSSILVMRDGKVLAQYRDPTLKDDGIDMMSATKSVVALGIGLLVTDGKIESLDQPVSDFYPEWKQGQKARITVRMLMNHTSGIQNVPFAPAEIYPAPDFVQLALAAELSDPPGSRFSYNNKAMNLLSGVIEKASGMPIDKFLEKRLFKPMGMTHSGWGEYDRAGHPQAMSGWITDAADAARIGQLVLDDGRWQGRQLVSVSFMREMTAQGSPLSAKYGLLWWRIPSFSHTTVRQDLAGVLTSHGIAPGIVALLTPLQGRYFASNADFMNAVVDAAGGQLRAVQTALADNKLGFSDLAKVDAGPVVAYEAEGYLGQYIVVVPATRIVAVRQIVSPATDVNPWPWNFDSFGDEVVKLGGKSASAGEQP
jgi:CubicO group peptidase (beta-lactamase class C family)